MSDNTSLFDFFDKIDTPKDSNSDSKPSTSGTKTHLHVLESDTDNEQSGDDQAHCDPDNRGDKNTFGLKRNGNTDDCSDLDEDDPNLAEMKKLLKKHQSRKKDEEKKPRHKPQVSNAEILMKCCQLENRMSSLEQIMNSISIKLDKVLNSTPTFITGGDSGPLKANYGPDNIITIRPPI